MRSQYLFQFGPLGFTGNPVRLPVDRHSVEIVPTLQVLIDWMGKHEWSVTEIVEGLFERPIQTTQVQRKRLVSGAKLRFPFGAQLDQATQDRLCLGDCDLGVEPGRECELAMVVVPFGPMAVGYRLIHTYILIRNCRRSIDQPPRWQSGLLYPGRVTSAV